MAITTLEAVNEILESIGEPPYTALDTGGTSIAAEAERFLDRYNKRLQMRGWAKNETRRYEMKVPKHKIAVSGGSGTFSYDETVTESVSGATFTFKAIDSSNVMHLVLVSGTPTGGQTLTGGTSGATRTGGALTIVSSNYLFLNPVWLTNDPADIEPRRVVQRGQYLYSETDQSALFSDSVFLDVVRGLYFEDCSHAFQTAVIALSSIYFARYKKRSLVDAQLTIETFRDAIADAKIEDQDQGRENILNTREAQGIQGRRNDQYTR